MTQNWTPISLTQLDGNVWLLGQYVGKAWVVYTAFALNGEWMSDYGVNRHAPLELEPTHYLCRVPSPPNANHTANRGLTTNGLPH